MVEPVLDRHSVESDVRAYTDARTERSMVVQGPFKDLTSVINIKSLVIISSVKF